MRHGATFFSAVSGAAWDDVVPLARVLEVTLVPESVTLTQVQGRALWKELSYLGSNDVAYLLRGLEGVDYPEIVRDVCKRLKIAELRAGEEERVVELNEQLVIRKIFADAWGQLDDGERGELLRELNLDAGHLPLAGASVAAAVLAGNAGAFAIYQLSVIVANWLTRALLGRGLALGANAALARVLEAVLAPEGWFGTWLSRNVASPALRKTVPAVVLVASLRQAKRAALAETAFADAEPSAESKAARAAPRRKGKRPAKRKPAKRPPAPRQRAKKKAAPPARSLPKSRAKKAVSKKKTAKKKRRSVLR